MTNNEYENMSSVEKLNFYRNKYYSDGNATEAGIIANAINDILPKDSKKIPKKPRLMSALFGLNGGYECPVCGNPYIVDTYCGCCGQALDWSEIK